MVVGHSCMYLQSSLSIYTLSYSSIHILTHYHWVLCKTFCREHDHVTRCNIPSDVLYHYLATIGQHQSPLHTCTVHAIHSSRVFKSGKASALEATFITEGAVCIADTCDSIWVKKITHLAVTPVPRNEVNTFLTAVSIVNETLIDIWRSERDDQTQWPILLIAKQWILVARM